MDIETIGTTYTCEINFIYLWINWFLSMFSNHSSLSNESRCEFVLLFINMGKMSVYGHYIKMIYWTKCSNIRPANQIAYNSALYTNCEEKGNNYKLCLFKQGLSFYRVIRLACMGNTLPKYYYIYLRICNLAPECQSVLTLNIQQ